MTQSHAAPKHPGREELALATEIGGGSAALNEHIHQLTKPWLSYLVMINGCYFRW
jgi:hypothetical protein